MSSYWDWLSRKERKDKPKLRIPAKAAETEWRNSIQVREDPLSDTAITRIRKLFRGKP